MNSLDQRIVRQVRWLLIAVATLIVLIGINFYIALAQPNKTTQTIVGPVGPQGALGLKGDKGDKGDQGDQGPAGVSGLPGANGTNGTNGENGVNGRDGVNGQDGLNGKDGADGAPGVNGRTPEMACVDGIISWKYTDETAWRSLNAKCDPPEVIGE